MCVSCIFLQPHAIRGQFSTRIFPRYAQQRPELPVDASVSSEAASWHQRSCSSRHFFDDQRSSSGCNRIQCHMKMYTHAHEYMHRTRTSSANPRMTAGSRHKGLRIERYLLLVHSTWCRQARQDSKYRSSWQPPRCCVSHETLDLLSCFYRVAICCCVSAFTGQQLPFAIIFRRFSI